MTELSVVHTVCRGCCFSLNQGKTQTGCLLGILDKIDSDKIIGAIDENQDQFYIINGTVCRYKRSNEWLKNDNESMLSIRDRLKKELEPKIEYIVYTDSVDAPNIQKTVESINNQEIKPIGVTFINHTVQEPTSIMQTWELLRDGISRRIRNITENDASRDRCIDIAVKDIKSRYFVIVDCGQTVPADLSSRLDYLVNEDLSKVMLIEFDGGYLSQLFWYKQMFGNNKMPYPDKIKELLQDKDFGNVYYRW